MWHRLQSVKRALGLKSKPQKELSDSRPGHRLTQEVRVEEEECNDSSLLHIETLSASTCALSHADRCDAQAEMNRFTPTKRRQSRGQVAQASVCVPVTLSRPQESHANRSSSRFPYRAEGFGLTSRVSHQDSPLRVIFVWKKSFFCYSCPSGHGNLPQSLDQGGAQA